MKTRTSKHSRGALQGSSARKGTAPHGGRRGSYPFSFRLKAVKLHLEEGYPVSLIHKEMGCTVDSVHRWLRCYQTHGEEGLRERRLSTAVRRASPEGKSAETKAKIAELKRKNPSYGVRRISDVLRRFFLIKAAPSTVHRTLKEEDLNDPPTQPRRKRNPGKPRFFERSTPNQLWQSDIMSFRMGGKAVYLIGYIDDYSRYIVGLGLYRAQTAENVLETYRRAAGDYNPPKEMLTDNGRQYANWRGQTRFQKEMQKDRIHHLRSQPHHPMTLGKIERFWKTILDEFLDRAKFEDFEQARERIALWVKYYNHKRPHQGIGGLCPADRFFEINHQLKQTLQSGIEDNILETALRGRPQHPFYMVGRMGDQSVVIRAEKGKVRMLVDGMADGSEQELTYKMEGNDNDDDNSNETRPEETHEALVQRGREDPRGPVDLDGTAQTGGCVPGADDYGSPAGPVAEESDGGDPDRDGTAPGAGSAGTAASPDREDPQQAGQDRAGLEACPQVERVAGWEGAGKEASSSALQPQKLNPHVPIQSPEETATSRSHLQSPQWTDERNRCGQAAGGLPQDVLPVGEEGAGSDDGSPGGRDRGTPIDEARPCDHADAADQYPPGDREQPAEAASGDPPGNAGDGRFVHGPPTEQPKL
nr:IS481 family transposase [Coraliomargarita parva]